MSLFGLVAVRFGSTGKLESAVIQQVDGATNSWIGTPRELDVSEIANMVTVGEIVQSVFVVPGGSVPGPEVRAQVEPNGTETIRLAYDIEGRRFTDLVQLGK